MICLKKDVAFCEKINIGKKVFVNLGFILDNYWQPFYQSFETGNQSWPILGPKVPGEAEGPFTKNRFYASIIIPLTSSRFI